MMLMAMTVVQHLADNVSTTAIASTATVIAAIIAVGGGWLTYRSGRNQTARWRQENESVGQRKLDQDMFKEFMTRQDAERRQSEDRVRQAEERMRRMEVDMQGHVQMTNEIWGYVLDLQSAMRHAQVPVPPRPPSLARMPMWTDMPSYGPPAQPPAPPSGGNANGGLLP